MIPFDIRDEHNQYYTDAPKFSCSSPNVSFFVIYGHQHTLLVAVTSTDEASRQPTASSSPDLDLTSSALT
jgi:hypothetical protein